MKLNSLFTLAVTALILSSCGTKVDPEITVLEIEDALSIIADDSLQGRYPGSKEDALLLSYLSGEMALAGLELQEVNGLQEVEVKKGYRFGSANYISYEEDYLSAAQSDGFEICGFSVTDTVRASLVFALEIPTKEESIENKILVLPIPEMLPKNPYDAFNALRDHALKAADKGVAGLIYICEGGLPALNSGKKASLNIPVGMLSAEVIGQDFDLEQLKAAAAAMKKTGVQLDTEISMMTEVHSKILKTYNTVAHLQGSNDSLAKQYVIIGAHHDHLGMGGRGTSSRRPDTTAVHYGADDNASGTIGVIEVAEKVASLQADRSFVFTTFAAEEMGLWGSKHYAANPTIDLSNAQIMINLDMIGRLNEDRQLQIGGVGTSPVLRAMLDTLNTKYNFKMAYSEAGFGPSDHSSFYAKDVPVLFISTGAHTDYHTPFDTKDKVNVEGMVEVLNFVSELAMEFANLPEKIEFTEAGPKQSSGSRGRMGGVTFGLMPDVMYDGNEGMPVSFVTEGKPAAVSGMKGGDIITTVDGKSVGNVQDYMTRLGELKEGQSVIVKVIRGEESIELLLQL